MTYLPDSDSCFVCGRVNPVGLNVRFTVHDGRVSVRLVPGEWRCGFRGVVHGGVLSSLLDEAMGWAPAYLKRCFCYTAELTVRFISPAPADTVLTVTGWMERDRGRVWETQGTVTDNDGTVYARATGKYLPMTPEQTVEIIDSLHFGPDSVSRIDLLPSQACAPHPEQACE